MVDAGVGTVLRRDDHTRLVGRTHHGDGNVGAGRQCFDGRSGAGGVNVPGDVLVIGFEGISSGEYNVPTLTTVATDFRGTANTSVSLLMRRIEHPDDEFYPQTVNVGYRLIERESTRR